MDLLKSDSGGSWTHEKHQTQPDDPFIESTTQQPAQTEPVPSAVLSIASDGNCCVLKSSNFKGQLRFEGSARIECHVSGEIQGSAVITVAENAVVTAPIRAASVLVAGRVSADIVASERIEVRPSAIIFGNLTAPAMRVHENATVEGRFTMLAVRS